MSSPDTARLAELAALAREARTAFVNDGDDDIEIRARYFNANHDLMAAANPTTIIGLNDQRIELLEEVAELTKALTGLTCGGSEFFNRKGDRYVADIPACVEYVKRRDRAAHEALVKAIYERNEARDKVAP